MARDDACKRALAALETLCDVEVAESDGQDGDIKIIDHGAYLRQRQNTREQVRDLIENGSAGRRASA